MTYLVICENAYDYPEIEEFKTKDEARNFYKSCVEYMFSDCEEHDDDERTMEECLEDTETSMYGDTVKVFEKWDGETYPLWSWNW